MKKSNLPAFIITIDTEGDNLWARPREVTTENARYLPRFQQLCEKYELKPVYLTNYEMAKDHFFGEFALDVLHRAAGEVGMHLHAWDSPPLHEEDGSAQAYLIEYPERVMREKIRVMTELLEERFQRKIVSHRAGRWALDQRYVRLLIEFGYRVDCSVTPFINWKNHPGGPGGKGGTDYTGFPEKPYFMDPHRIDRSGDSPLLEVPVSVVVEYARTRRIVKHFPWILRHLEQRRFHRHWLYPDGSNRKAMLRIMQRALQEKWPCVVFVLHSSELMPGGSPGFGSAASIDALYADLEVLFDQARERFRGMTLEGFYQEWCRGKNRNPGKGAV